MGAMVADTGRENVSSEELFGVHDRLLIEHGDGRYLLRQIFGGGLLLTRWQEAGGILPARHKPAPERDPAKRRRSQCVGLYGRIWFGKE